MLIPITIWAVYAGRILSFNNKQLHTDPMRFVFNLQFLPHRQQLILSAVVLFMQLLPATCYGAFLVYISYRVNALQPVIMVFFAIGALWSTGAFLMSHMLRHPFSDLKISRITRFFDEHYIRRPIQFYTEALLRADGIMIFGTKLLTGFLIFGVCTLYHYEPYDGRLLAMALTLCGVANALVTFRLVLFEHAHMAWMKNMPIASWKRFTRLTIVTCLIALPEAIVLGRHFPAHLPDILLLTDLLYLISLGAWFLGYFHVRGVSLEHHTRAVFWAFIITVILILFEVPLVIFIAINFGGGFWLFTKGYYKLELVE